MARDQSKTEKITRNDLQQVHDTMLMVAVIQAATRLSGKYIKQTLTRLESDGILTPTTRKHVLDGFGDYARELQEILNQLI